MKFNVRATVIFEWEEDSDTWVGVEHTREAILQAVREYAKDDATYVLDCEHKIISIEEATP